MGDAPWIRSRDQPQAKRRRFLALLIFSSCSAPGKASEPSPSEGGTLITGSGHQAARLVARLV
jgi:hypothetical protein